MKKIFVSALAAFVLVAPAEASAVPYLGPGEACRVAGRIIHEKYDNIVPGSSRGNCYTYRVRRDVREVDIFYRDYSGQWWTMSLGIREAWSGYRYRVFLDKKVRSPALY